MKTAAVEGTITQVERRGKQTYCFEGIDLRKVGRSETIRLEFAETIYTGELVALAPTRAIVLISSHRPDHGIRSIAASIAASA
jgi:hypothetical protein